ncbi:MAG: peptide deformylase [PVC group bacterium]|nr:peptide deformylase [PVC group bacterium]
MQKLEVCKKNNPILRKRSQKLPVVGEPERALFENMLRIMHQEKGIGLAAPQVGILKQMLVIDIGQGPLRLVNPQILKKQGRSLMKEGCLSLPGVEVEVRRAKSIVVVAQDDWGKEVKIIADDLLARALQHEIDHLKGVLILDYLPWYKQVLLKIKKFKWS